MTSLYKITGVYQERINAMLATLDDESGDVSEKMAEILSIKEFAIEKQQNIAAYVLNLESDAAQMGEYINAMAERKKAAMRKIERLKDLLKMSMVILEQDQVQCDEFTIKLKNNRGSVVINNEELIPDEFMRTKTIKEPDKTKIAEALKKETVSENGEIIPGNVLGCHFEKGKRIEIK